MRKEFTKTKHHRNGIELTQFNHYDEKKEMTELDVEAFRYYISGGNNSLGSRTEALEEVLVLPDDVIYYSRENGKNEVSKVIPKGTTVYLSIAVPGGSLYGYGFMSLPTYEKKWRVAIPFIEAGESFCPDEAQLYYIKTADIQKLIRHSFTEELLPNRSSILAKSYLTERKELWHALGFSNDMSLLGRGIYLSPAYHLPVFDVWDAFFLLTGILLISYMIINRRKGKASS